MKPTQQIFQQVILNRYSCRSFRDSTISQESLEYILEAGRLSPSSLGLEPWRFYVVQDKDKKVEISAIANHQNHVENCGAILILTARLDFGEYFVSKLKSRKMPQAEIEKRITLYKPFIDKMDLEQKLHYAREQVFLALGNLANATSALGLGSCIIGGFDSDKLDKYLKLDTTKERSVILLIIGEKTSDEIPLKIRNPKEEIIKFL
ncbi:nitroreductase family protein [uncultured Helicobacter sp.]|uniref:nitroreductase family protein n=1 Tax=uncultured Helicobacter sp. TaxID=175537 RepID=UPI002610EC45|nr:nitroreductase family protein [uncultured Helicobacter sp.]